MNGIRRATAGGWVLIAALGCGGISVSSTRGATGTGGHAETGGSAGQGGKSATRGRDGGSGGTGGADSLTAYLEDACPNVVAPEADIECDPIAQTGCPSGASCYPFPPEGVDPCHPGQFQTLCSKSGTGTQGTECGSIQGCKGGYVCAVTGQGNQCIQLCHPGDIGACPDGLVCGPLDIPDYGGCL